MEDNFDSLLFNGELSPEQRDAFRQRMEDDPELAKAWTGWRQVRAQLRRRLQEHLTDRRLLVLYVLEQDGYGAALTTEEQQILEASRDDLTEAIEAIPALEQVVERIREERADFEAVWRQHKGTERTEPVSTPSDRSWRSDRAPRSSQSQKERTKRQWGRRLAVAVVLIGMGILAVLFGPQGSSQTTIEIAENEQQVLELDDGSTVRLKGAATLTYSPEALEKQNRQVTLERGQAFFDVALREEASFVVETPTATTTALGTQFGVSTGGDSTEVVLASGRVRVGSSEGASEDAVQLRPGERSLVQRGRPPTPPTSVDLTSVLDWTDLFVFRSVPFGDIAQQLGEHYDVTITVASELTGEPVTGTFERDQPVGQVLEALAATLGAEVQQEGDAYHLSAL